MLSGNARKGESLLGFVFLRVDLVQFLAWLEANGATRSNADLAAGSGVSPDPGLARSHAEHAKATQFDPVACGKRLLQAIKYAVNRGLGFHPWQSGSLNHLVNDVLLDQRSNPFLQILQRHTDCIAGVSIFIRIVIVNRAL